VSFKLYRSADGFAVKLIAEEWTSADDGWPYDDMQNTDIGLAALVKCHVCPVTDGKEPEIHPDLVCRPHFRSTGSCFSRPSRDLSQTTNFHAQRLYLTKTSFFCEKLGKQYVVYSFMNINDIQWLLHAALQLIQ